MQARSHIRVTFLLFLFLLGDSSGLVKTTEDAKMRANLGWPNAGDDGRSTRRQYKDYHYSKFWLKHVLSIALAVVYIQASTGLTSPTDLCDGVPKSLQRIFFQSIVAYLYSQLWRMVRGTKWPTQTLHLDVLGRWLIAASNLLAFFDHLFLWAWVASFFLIAILRPKVCPNLQRRTVLAAGGTHVMMIGTGRLFAWGESSALPLNSDRDSSGTRDSSSVVSADVEGAFIGPYQIEFFSDKMVTDVATGPTHTLVLTATGDVYGFGSNGEGEISSDIQDQHVNSPVHLVSNATHIATGTRFSAVVVKGKIYTFGSNINGQLGTGHSSEERGMVGEVEFGSPVTEIAAGDGHMLALCEDRRVFSWGLNSHGQLGIGKGVPDANTVPTPTEVSRLPLSVVGLSAGATHSLAVTAEGHVLGFGSNESGQLGVPIHQTAADGGCAWSPVIVPELTRVRTVRAGSSHSIALTQAGQVFTWGSNTRGELGIGAISAFQTSPTQVGGLLKGRRVDSIAAGDQSTVVATASGLAFVWGDNEEGQLGSQQHGDVVSPLQLALHAIKSGQNIDLGEDWWSALFESLFGNLATLFG